MNKNRYNKISRYLNKTDIRRTIVPFIPSPSEHDYKLGYIVRYFVQSINNESAPIYEVSGNEFSKFSFNPFYKTTQLDWLIIGKKSEVRKSNEESILIASKILPNLKLYLPNLVQFYDPSYYTEPTLDKVFAEDKEIVTIRQTGSAFQNSPPPTIVEAPTGVSIDTNTLEVTWNPVSIATGYDLYLSYDGGEFSKYNEDPITNVSIILEGIVNGVYSLYVVAIAAIGESSPSNIVSFTYSELVAAFSNNQFQTPYYISNELFEVTQSGFETPYYISNELFEVTQSGFETPYYISNELFEVTQSGFEGTIDKPDAPSNLEVTVEEVTGSWYNATSPGAFTIVEPSDAMRVGSTHYHSPSNSFYVVGPYNGSTYTSNAYEYNISTGVWTTISTTVTSNRADVLPVRAGNYVYYGCGFDNNGQIQKLDITTGIQTNHYSFSDSTYKAMKPAYDEVNDRYFLAGSREGNDNGTETVMVTNFTTTPSHTLLADFPGLSPYGGGTVYLNDYLYVKDGGVSVGSTSTSPNTNWYRLHIPTNTWEQLAAIPEAVRGVDIYPNGDNLRMAFLDSLNEIQFYDYNVTTDSFTIIPKLPRVGDNITNGIDGMDNAGNLWILGGLNRDAANATVSNVSVRVFG